MRKLTYTITTETGLLDEKYGVTEEQSAKMQECYRAIQEDGYCDIEKVKKLVQQYPHIPHFQNYLTVGYLLAGRVDLAFLANDRLLNQFPDYLFAKVNKANEFVEKKQFEKVKLVLGPALDLQALYPERH
ncbi:hypothetical protein JXA02_02935, partial [candidate division KSB1 bacterium]